MNNDMHWEFRSIEDSLNLLHTKIDKLMQESAPAQTATGVENESEVPGRVRGKTAMKYKVDVPIELSLSSVDVKYIKNNTFYEYCNGYSCNNCAFNELGNKETCRKVFTAFKRELRGRENGRD